jgi:hypothetical protein
VDDQNAWTVRHHNGAQQSKRWDERHLARLGSVQDGIVRLESPDAKKRRIAQQRRVVVHRGVYAVGHRDVSERGRLRAAVWACGEGAAPFVEAVWHDDLAGLVGDIQAALRE